MSANSVKRRQRFSPEKRRSLILDFTAEIVAREGVAQLSMELIGKEAGVSKSLVYNYFDNLTELLRELLEREHKELRRLQFAAAEKATTLEEKQEMTRLVRRSRKRQPDQPGGSQAHLFAGSFHHLTHPAVQI